MSEHIRRTVTVLPNRVKLAVIVWANGWTAMYGDTPTPLADIPTTYHIMIKAAVKDVAYDAGWYKMKPPPGPTGLWDRVDWINYVTFDFPI